MIRSSNAMQERRDAVGALWRRDHGVAREKVTSRAGGQEITWARSFFLSLLASFLTSSSTFWPRTKTHDVDDDVEWGAVLGCHEVRRPGHEPCGPRASSRIALTGPTLDLHPAHQNTICKSVRPSARRDDPPARCLLRLVVRQASLHERQKL